MANKISIITYHYVRDLEHSRYPEIKGLSIERFRGQLRHILSKYKVIRMEDLIEAVKFQKKLPPNAVLLTFDDGYKDHFDAVFPILTELGVQGSFFIPARAIQEHCVLDVNKIHFILASVKNKKILVDDIFSMLDKYRKEYSLKENGYYYKKLARKIHGKRFDTKEVIFIKLILQRELPEKLRNIISGALFKKYVCHDEESFSRELYMSMEQIRCMKKYGMYIGSHGFNHCYLDTLSYKEQEREINLSVKFLKKIGCDVSAWVMCYPYGVYDDYNSLIYILKKNGCALGLTTRKGIADLSKDDILVLPRLDTNDLPQTLRYG